MPIAADMNSATTRAALTQIISVSLDFTAQADLVPLVSKVPGKQYAMLVREGRTSRPINLGLYRDDLTADELLAPIFSPVAGADPHLLDECLYTAAMSFPLACDLAGSGNKKSPGTYFEIFVAHLFATQFNVNPRTYVDVPMLDAPLRIPTDFIFQLPLNRRLHVPVKISTRERVVQVWAHQKLLDGIHGTGRFKGILVCLTETNKQKEESVVEVVLPNQWVAYQMYIATMTRIYYLDPPARYLALRDTFPNIQVWPLSRFLQEAPEMVTLSWP
jgi:hypothetical protein